MSNPADRILEVTQALALTQAANPNERDEAGFSNADFPAAFTMVALGDINACAALLRLYPRQAALNGITPEMLQPYLGDSTGMANAEARAALGRARKEAAGTLAWTKLPNGKILFNGLELSSQIRKQLRQHGTRTAQGWIVDSSKISLAIQGQCKTAVAHWDDLQAIIAATPQQQPDPRATGKPAPPPMEIAYDGKGSLQWTNPFSDAGVEIRRLVKLLGARFDGTTKAWKLADPLALQALSLLAEDLDVPVHGVEVSEAFLEPATALAEEVRSGVVKIIIVDETPEFVFYRTRSKVDGAWEAAKANGGWFVAEKSCIRVAKDDLRNLLNALDNIKGLDTSSLLPILNLHEASQQHAVPPDVLAQVPFKTPTGYDLFDPHQREGVAYLLTLGWDGKVKGGILADDMGLGKTIQACVAANIRWPESDARFLIVCPASLKHNWAFEIQQWLGKDQTVQVLSGRSDVLGDARWTVINYDILANYVDVLRAANFKAMIIDEAHNLRNPDTQRGKAALGAKSAKGKAEDPGISETCEQVWMLTGTPMMNRPKELWNLLRGIGHPLGNDWWRYATRYCAPKNSGYGWNFDGASNLGELSNKMASCYLKRLKSKVLNLPPKIRAPYIVDLSPEEMAAYHAAVDAMLGRLGGEDESEVCILAELNALKLQTARAKMPATIELAEQIVDEGGKVVVFSFYLEVLDALQEKFGKAAVRIDGSVNPDKRKGIVDTFQTDPKVTVFLGQIEAAGVGITLTASQDVIVNDLPWTPAILSQAEDRTWRIGQTGTVNVRHMIAHGTFDANLREILAAKTEVIEAFEAGADAASQARFSVIKKVLQAIKKEAKGRAAGAVA